MANGSATHVDTEARYAQLGERVTNISQRQHDLETEMRRGFGELSQAVNVLSNELRGSSRTQWPVIWSAIGVCFVVITAIGGLAYAPVLNNINRLDQSQQATVEALREITQSVVSRDQFAEFKGTYENNRVVSRQDLNDRFGTLTTQMSEMVPRRELERVWQAYDNRFSDMQRQTDELKQQAGSVYSARDLLLDLRNRLSSLETQRERTP